MINLTIAICTYNGESRFPEVLDCLACQVGTEAIAWEIIVIDNASQDRTPEVFKQYQADWIGPCPLKYVFEPKKGLAFARLRAVAEASGELVAFLDDDNLPTPTWVAETYAFAQQHPQAGAFGGQVHGAFEVTPPDYFEKIAMFLAIVERGQTPYCYSPAKRMLPPGAGLVVRRQAWLDNVPNTPLLRGRAQNSMLAGEDLEVIVYIQKAGWEVWYNSAMKLNHKIPQHRLEKSYLIKLAWGTGLSRHHIRMIRYTRLKQFFLTPLHILNDLGKVLTYLPTYCLNTQKSFAVVFELNYRVATFISPFYLLKSYFAGKFSVSKNTAESMRLVKQNQI